MIDMACISVFFLPEYVHETSHGGYLADIESLCSELDMTLQGEIYYKDGKRHVRSLRHNFESLPSSFGSLAYKVIDGTDLKKYPYVRISGNPAKLLQGHNVYGSDNAELCIFSVVEAFMLAFPELSAKLDWFHSVVDYIDVTYSARVDNEAVAQQVIDTLKNLSYGQTKASSHDKYRTTVYWNKGSEHKELKAYMKKPELDRQIKLLTKKWIKEKYDHIKYQLLKITSPEVREMADGAIRFEARLKSRWLSSNGIPVVAPVKTDSTNLPF